MNYYKPNTDYDVAIIGGGLAGLSMAILLRQKGHRVILFEKEKYPFHKVCGEYISMESWHFIKGLGLNLDELQLPIIKNLVVSAPNGNFLTSKLDMGGFGISRYLLDNQLKEIAERKGVTIFEGTKINEVSINDTIFTLKYNGGELSVPVVASGYGKKSNLDVKWNRNFTIKKATKLNNYIGVKYHIKTDFPVDTIALHNFENGYCGISRIEDNTYCLCYLTTAKNLQINEGSLKKMEENILYKNPFLHKIFTNSTFLFSSPVTISQISFDKKSQVENHILMIGDAAGMITPLCGNGMSMAMHSAKLAAEQVDNFLQQKITREEMENNFRREWQRLFSSRLKRGRLIQQFFGKSRTTNLFVGLTRQFPWLVNRMIKSTHGKEF
ncbi:MAG: NAD(P)/FAD-dependent oxidoreductase [Ginsengibacter sp.]